MINCISTTESIVFSQLLSQGILQTVDQDFSLKQLQFLSWNVQGIRSKLNDQDFLEYISKFDVLIFTETWHSEITNLNIDGFDNFSCPRPQANKNAKRNSGGFFVFFKRYLNGRLELIESDEKGFFWFKLNKEYSYLTTDTYFCCCYIPPFTLIQES